MSRRPMASLPNKPHEWVFGLLIIICAWIAVFVDMGWLP